MPRSMNPDKNAPVSLALPRRFGVTEEFTLFEDKVRVETRKRFGNAIVEIPLRFLDPTWVLQKGSSHFRYLVFAVGATAATAAVWLHGPVASQGTERWMGFAGVLTLIWLFGAPLALLGWWKGRYDVLVFTTLHPNYGNLVIARDAARELEIMQFADATSERIKLLQLTKPDG